MLKHKLTSVWRAATAIFWAGEAARTTALVFLEELGATYIVHSSPPTELSRAPALVADLDPHVDIQVVCAASWKPDARSFGSSRILIERGDPHQRMHDERPSVAADDHKAQRLAICGAKQRCRS